MSFARSLGKGAPALSLETISFWNNLPTHRLAWFSVHTGMSRDNRIAVSLVYHDYMHIKKWVSLSTMHYERVTSCGTRAPLPFYAERVSLGQNSHHSEVMPESQVPSRATKSAGYALIRHVFAITGYHRSWHGDRWNPRRSYSRRFRLIVVF